MQRIQNGQKVAILYFGDHDPSGLDMVRDIKERIMDMFLKGEQGIGMTGTIGDWLRGQDTQLLAERYADHDELWIKKKGKEDKINVPYMFFSEHYKVKHIGLTMKQIEEYNPPHNPAKITDPRAKDYIAKFGQKSWEVDALSPSIMEDIVSDAIWELIDVSIYSNIIKKEEADKKQILKTVQELYED